MTDRVTGRVTDRVQHALHRWRASDAVLFNALFAVASSILILFVIIPLGSILLGAPPALLWRTLTDRAVQSSLALTVYAGILATLCATISGIPLAYLLARRSFHGKQLVEAIVDVPLIIPHTAAGVALLTVFGSRGIIGQPLTSLNVRFTDSLPGIVVGMLFVGMPFLVNTARTAFTLIDADLETVAWSEGASAWQAFTLITLPLAWRGIIAGALLMWARGVSEFGAVVILAYHPQIVPVLVYERFQGFGLSAAQAISAILIVVALLVFSALRHLLESQQRKM